MSTKVIAPTTVENPHQRGSMKHQAFAAFARGGPRDQVIARMRQSGATRGSIEVWFSLFRGYVRRAARGQS